MSPRTLSLAAFAAVAFLFLQIPACGLNTSGALESEGDEAGAQAGGQTGAAGKGGGTSSGGKSGQAGAGGKGGSAAGSSGQSGASGTGNSAGDGGVAGAAGTVETGGAAGASGEGGATPDGGAGTAGAGGAVHDSGPDVVDAADDVVEAGGDSGPVCGLQDTAHPACNACMMQKCLSDCQACAANSECVVLVNCIAGCNGDGPCQKHCWDDHPSGQSGANELGGDNGCLRDQCGDECSWLPDTGGSGCAVARESESEGWMVGVMAAAGLAIAVGRRRLMR